MADHHGRIRRDALRRVRGEEGQSTRPDWVRRLRPRIDVRGIREPGPEGRAPSRPGGSCHARTHGHDRAWPSDHHGRIRRDALRRVRGEEGQSTRPGWVRPLRPRIDVRGIREPGPEGRAPSRPGGSCQGRIDAAAIGYAVCARGSTSAAAANPTGGTRSVASEGRAEVEKNPQFPLYVQAGVMPSHEQLSFDLATASAGEANRSKSSRPDWRAVLTPEERRELCETDNWHGWVTLATNWGIVFAAMGLVAWAPNPLTVVVALFVIGSRQLGLAVVMHEAAHRILFRNRRLNDWAGQWLAAYPIWSDTETYRTYHLRHHAHTWTKDDPDLGLATPFPVSRASMRRKVLRDLTGRTGLKFARFALDRDTGLFSGKPRGGKKAGWRRLGGMLLTNAALLALLAVAGYPWLYLLWAGAWFTTYTLVTRFRSIAEHSMVPDPSDELRNTRTTLARWWERLFLAPNHVNYHLEHHLVMTVPHFKLPKFHRLLRERGVLDHALVARGYLEVLRAAASR
ncbi:MAG: hypothetical protein KatS3mg076_3223 [Candidatus Binatia bacterium]|nr:MAG: hypothetical protein KatS3mg076_3223 [Candidatus Binatia bacterium]